MRHVLTQVSYHLPSMTGVSRGWHRKRVAPWTAHGVASLRGGKCEAAMQWEPAHTCQRLVREDWLPFQESHSHSTRPSPFHGSKVHTLYLEVY